MNHKQLCLENIHNLSSSEISYLLYKEGKSIDQIAIIRGMKKEQVQKDIIEAKLVYAKEYKKSILVSLMSMIKKDRIRKLAQLTNEETDILKEELYKDYIKYKTDEDRMILIWLIGELEDKKFLPFLRMELKSKRVNHRRLACSALGKFKDVSSKSWLEKALNDDNPQVRQYAIKALMTIGDQETLAMIKKIVNKTQEKAYVKKAANEFLENFKK